MTALDQYAAQAGKGAMGSVQISTFQVADMALSDAASLAFRVEDIVNRLCGCIPVSCNAGSTAGVPGSVLSTLREKADTTAERVRAAMAALDRLDRELP